MANPNKTYKGAAMDNNNFVSPQARPLPGIATPSLPAQSHQSRGSRQPNAQHITEHQQLNGSYWGPSSNITNDPDAFPTIAGSKPVSSLPQGRSAATANFKGAEKDGKSSDLEDRMRGMIIQNEQTSNAQNPMPQNRPLRKANQARRRQQNAESKLLLSQTKITPVTQEFGPLRRDQIAKSQPRGGITFGAPYSHVPPPRELQYGGYDRGALTPIRDHTLPNRGGCNQYSRPPAKNRQLFDPHRTHYNPATSVVNSRPQMFQQNELIQNQLGYINATVDRAVSAAMISDEDFESMHKLRLDLEGVCRDAVSKHEALQHDDFIPDSVRLESFGSLATTFATKGSDMDLVLLSPQSIPDATSAESPLPRLIEKALLEMRYGARLLTKTRVPIIKFCERPDDALAQRLRHARQQWEEEETTNIQPKETSKRAKRGAAQDTELDRPHPPLPQNRPGFADIPVQSQKIEETRSRDSLPAANDHTANVRNSETISPVFQNWTDKVAKAGVASEPSLDLERHDPTLETRSDVERVRLYRLAMKEDWYEPQERSIIVNFIQAVDSGSEALTISEAREKLQDLPNILKRYRLPPEKHLDFPKHGVGIQCDINFSNHLALHNSALLRCYSLCDTRVRPLVLFVKAWAKVRKINSAYESTLSSYGYVLMVLHFLVNIARPPVLPNLQHHPLIHQDEVSSELVELDGYNIQFFRNETVIKDHAARSILTQNRENVGSLARGFFQYFGSEGYNNFHWMKNCLSLRTPGGIITKESKGWTAAKTEIMDAGPGSQKTKDIRQRYLVAIEDPFEIHHNVGRPVSHDGIVAIRDEFRRGFRLISTAGVGPMGPEDLLAEVERQGNIEYRYFGPNPKKDFKRRKQHDNGKGNADRKPTVHIQAQSAGPAA